MEKNPAAVELGRLGGLARVPKGLATMDPKDRRAIQRKGWAARRKQAKEKKS